MPLFNHLPVADWLNEGWSLVGTGVTALFEALNNDDDAKFIQSPSSKGSATVSFPIDTSSVPEGAVITSVTIKARVGLGLGSAPSGVAPSVTFAVSADDNTARYATRTIYPTSTPTTYTVGTFTRDALNLSWDVHRLNHLLCRVFSYVGVADLCRIFKFFCEINYRIRPTVTITAPSGTVTTPSPVIAWNYEQSDGDQQKWAEYRIFTAAKKAEVSFNPEYSTPVSTGMVFGDQRSITLPDSLNPDSYWVYVRAASSFLAVSRWAGKQFTVSGPAPGIPGDIDPTTGGSLISVVDDPEQGAAQITIRDTSNMLDPQSADAESSTEGPVYTNSGCNVVRSTTVAYPGETASWSLTATGAGNMTIDTDYVEVDSSGEDITGRIQFRAASTTRSCRARIDFYDSQFNAVSGTLTGTSVTDSASTWTEVLVTGPIPAGTVYARLSAEVLSVAGSEVHYIDHLGLMYGSSTPWSSGGQMSRNLLSCWYSTAEGAPGSGEAWTAGPGTSTTTATATGTGASGWTCHKMTYVGLSPTIAWRAAGTAFQSGTSGSDFTLNKPAGVVSGDLMLAFLTCNEYDRTLTVPSGWTLADTVKVDDGSTEDVTMFVLKRTAGGSEPATWSATLSSACGRRTAVVVAYSGAADAASQFLGTAQASAVNGTPLYATTGAVNNTDPGAWRVSAFAVSDNASGGTLTANRQQPSAVPGIQYVGKASAWTDSGNPADFVINKPAGIQAGDLMVATLGAATEEPTVNPPAGWTLVENSQSNSADFTFAVMYRYATGSEPNSWTGSLTAIDENFNTRVTQCVAYRNVDQTTPFIAENGTLDVDGQTLYTPSVTNTNSMAWRICAFGADAPVDGNYGFTSNESVERADNNARYNGGFFGSKATTAVAMYDSNGPVSTGSYSRSGTFGTSYHAMAAWIGILKPLSAPPSGVADETARQVAAAGASNPWLTSRVFDSNGVVPVGPQSITGIWAPGSGSDMNSMVGWQGLIIPASPTVGGYGSADMATTVDISNIDPVVLDLCGRKVSVTASFLGSVASTPYLTLHCYRANQLLQSLVAEGDTFGTSVWAKSAATFDLPEGTTRVKLGVSASNLAVSDIVYFDRCSIALGSSQGYRPGTSRSTHPVWSRPEFQFADDAGSGYDEFATLPGSLSNAPEFDITSGVAVLMDHTVIPLTNRKYRAKTVAYGLAGDLFVSAYGSESSEFRFEAVNWWIKDISNPDNNIQLSVAWEDLSIAKTNTATVFQPMGAKYPVVVSEGYKGDMFTLSLRPVNSSKWVQLRDLLESGQTLFIQSDIDHAWFVRPVGDLAQVVMATNQRRANPLRVVTIQFVEVEPEF
ncbi:hypothetical protein [Rhodococcus sp. 11-3]|uniref:hypothetical protein n=1 Tax=Rhodococcus sp. 11-3 TaxID=2854796 RepID=UPI00203C3C64|nr:hypothetical protein [Rhodococcus sp. 11-3]USC17043.1 hypothetical protein KZJ41_09325 [Rhodococcus sp. 11-3]